MFCSPWIYFLRVLQAWPSPSWPICLLSTGSTPPSSPCSPTSSSGASIRWCQVRNCLHGAFRPGWECCCVPQLGCLLCQGSVGSLIPGCRPNDPVGMGMGWVTPCAQPHLPRSLPGQGTQLLTCPCCLQGLLLSSASLLATSATSWLQSRTSSTSTTAPTRAASTPRPWRQPGWRSLPPWPVSLPSYR